MLYGQKLKLMVSQKNLTGHYEESRQCWDDEATSGFQTVTTNEIASHARNDIKRDFLRDHQN